MDYIKHVQDRATPQSEPIPGREAEMKPNNAGGVTFTLDDWARLDRFLILGTEGGTYYAGEHEHTKQAFDATLRCIAADGRRVVQRIVEISDDGRAPKNDPAIVALAAAMKKGDDATRTTARAAVPRVCRIGTHLFHLAAAIEGFGGWGRGTRSAFAKWYTERDPDDLALQLAKYQSRDKWSHRDVLRLAKPHGHERGGAVDRLLGWSAGKAAGPVHPLVDAFEEAKRAETPKDSARLIAAHNLPRECVRTDHLDSVEVWDALLHAGKHGMPMTAMMRNLGKMGAIGLLAPMSDASRFVVARLGDRESLRHARVHPLAVLVAMQTYASGHGVRGSNTWTAVHPVVDALDGAFYAAFDFVEPTGKRWYLGLDVSGSMGSGLIAGLPGITPRIATAALAMVTTKIEPQTYAAAFTAGRSGYGGMYGGGSSGLTPFALSQHRRLDDVCRAMAALPMGGTDCSLPMIDALAKRIPVDCFVVYTDSETWAGRVQPVQALRAYRQGMGIDARLIVVGMTGTEFTIADPTDAGMIDVVGMDTATPAAMAEFVR